MFKLGFFRSAQHWPSFTLSQVGCSLDAEVSSFLVPGVPTAIKDYLRLCRGLILGLFHQCAEI